MKNFILTIDEQLNNKTVAQLLNHLKISRSLITELKKGDFIHETHKSFSSCNGMLNVCMRIRVLHQDRRQRQRSGDN